jgi:hypothetical protein
VRFAVASRTLSAAILLVTMLAFSSALCAQQQETLSLKRILDRLDANLSYYDARVPSLFCDERVVSSQAEPGMRDVNTVADSVFRLKRTLQPDHTVSLVESREIQLVDGKPATSQAHYDPTMLSGAFEGGLAVVSRSQSACMSYSLRRTKRGGPREPYVVRFATVLTPQNSAGCLLQENSSGRAFVDPVSLQVTRLELTTPHHVIIPGSPFRIAHTGQAGPQRGLCACAARWRDVLDAFRDHHAQRQWFRDLSHDDLVVQGYLPQLPPDGSHIAHPSWRCSTLAINLNNRRLYLRTGATIQSKSRPT